MKKVKREKKTTYFYNIASDKIYLVSTK